MTLLRPGLRALAQLDDPVLRRAVLGSLGWALAGIVVLAVGLSWGGHRVWLALGGTGGAAAGGWAGTLAGIASWLAGPFGTVLAGILLFLPLAALIATFYAETVAAAVERRWYPALPPAAPAPLLATLWDGLALGGLVLPGVGMVLGWLVTAWALGRGLFVALAMRRMDRAEARALCRARRGAVLTQGGLMAALGMVPILALLAPVLGTAALVHVLHAERR
jgi:uncharacterized protein involved in cysteine biosynthesis